MMRAWKGASQGPRRKGDEDGRRPEAPHERQPAAIKAEDVGQARSRKACTPSGFQGVHAKRVHARRSDLRPNSHPKPGPSAHSCCQGLLASSAAAGARLWPCPTRRTVPDRRDVGGSAGRDRFQGSGAPDAGVVHGSAGHLCHQGDPRPTCTSVDGRSRSPRLEAGCCTRRSTARSS
jgi:hypothetical protein